MLTILDAILLGLIEGITEFLPVSSTGHLVLVASMLGLDEPPEVRSATDALLIVIQGGAILAVLGLYRTSVARMCRGLLGKDRDGLRLARNIVIAFLPAAVLGPLLNDTIETHLFSPGPVLGALAAGGVLMLFMHRIAPGGTDGRSGIDLTIKAALFIGLLQCLAMWPGTSRSMVTIVGAMFMGLSAVRAAEFSFLLGLPTLGGACVYTMGRNLMGDGPNMFDVLGAAPIFVGIVCATVSAAIAIRWLVAFLNRHGLVAFGWYRLALAALLGGLLWSGQLHIGQSDDVDDPLALSRQGDALTDRLQDSPAGQDFDGRDPYISFGASGLATAMSGLGWAQDRSPAFREPLVALN